jgi:hypothetical protein
MFIYRMQQRLSRASCIFQVEVTVQKDSIIILVTHLHGVEPSFQNMM